MPRKPTRTTATKASTARTRKTTKTADAQGGSSVSAPATPAKRGVGRPKKSEATGYAGFLPGSASELAAKALVAGGPSRTDIMHALRDNDPDQNVSANWSVAISQTTKSLLGKGFTIDGHFRLVPPAGFDDPTPEAVEADEVVEAVEDETEDIAPATAAPAKRRGRPRKTAVVETPDPAVDETPAATPRRGRPRRKSA